MGNFCQRLLRRKQLTLTSEILAMLVSERAKSRAGPPSYRSRKNWISVRQMRRSQHRP